MAIVSTASYDTQPFKEYCRCQHSSNCWILWEVWPIQWHEGEWPKSKSGASSSISCLPCHAFLLGMASLVTHQWRASVKDERQSSWDSCSQPGTPASSALQCELCLLQADFVLLDCFTVNWNLSAPVSLHLCKCLSCYEYRRYIWDNMMSTLICLPHSTIENDVLWYVWYSTAGTDQRKWHDIVNPFPLVVLRVYTTSISSKDCNCQ